MFDMELGEPNTSDSRRVRLPAMFRFFARIRHQGYHQSSWRQAFRDFSSGSSKAAAAEETVWEKVKNFGPRHPVILGVAISTIKTGAADYLVQKYVEGKEKIDMTRLAVFTSFGCLYLGYVQYALYVPVFRMLFPNAAKFGTMTLRQKLRDTVGLKTLTYQVAIDNFIYAPFIFFPCYYITKEGLQGDSNALNSSPAEFVPKALSRYVSANFLEDNLDYWKVWIPGNFVVFALPLWVRLPAVHGISFLYVCLLSASRGAKETTPIHANTDELTL